MEATLEKIRPEVSCIASGYYIRPGRTSVIFVLEEGGYIGMGIRKADGFWAYLGIIKAPGLYLPRGHRGGKRKMDIFRFI